MNNLKQRVCKITENTPIETVQRCSRRCREYKLFYYVLLETNLDNDNLKLNNIKKMKKEIKNKYCAMDQDYGLVKQLAKQVKKKIIDIKIIDVMKFEFTEDKNENSLKKCPLIPV